MKKHTILSLIVLIILGTFSPVFYANASSPEGVRLSWQHDPQTTITVMWRTSSNSTPATVQYGTSTALGQTKNGANTESVESGFYYHTAELTGLTPATTYYYRVLGDGNTLQTLLSASRLLLIMELMKHLTVKPTPSKQKLPLKIRPFMLLPEI